jgi:hypothetical protein
MMCAVVLAAGPASADPLAVHVDGELPFTVAQLDAALAVRASVAESAHAITATVTGDGAMIHVAVLGRDKSLQLEGERGVDAARLVAFVILDLAADQLDPPQQTHAAPPPAMPAIVAPRPQRSTASMERSIVLAPERAYEPRMALAVWGRGGTRTDVELELALPVAGSVRALVSGGAGTQVTYTGISATALSTPITVRAYPVRAGLAWRGPNVWLGELELRAGAVALVESASAMTSSTSAIYGGGAAVAWAMPILELAGNRGATITFAAGGDAFATSDDFRLHGTSAAVTPRVAWWGGLAIAAELWR